LLSTFSFGSNKKIKQSRALRDYIESFERRCGDNRSLGGALHQRRFRRVSPMAEQMTVERSRTGIFPRRLGTGQTISPSPYVVLASAIAGKIIEPAEFLTAARRSARCPKHFLGIDDFPAIADAATT